MKILHIASMQGISGIVTMIRKIVPYQIRLGNDVRVVSICNNQCDELTIYTIKYKKQFKNFIKSWNPDIVIFHSMYEFSYIGFYEILFKNKIPYLIQMHGALSVSNYHKNFLKKVLANFFFFESFIKKAESLIYLNKQEYTNCIAKRYNSSAIILPNGCDLYSDIDLGRSIESTLEIVYIGRIEFAHKALDVLIDALKILYTRNVNNIHFSFYGIGNKKDINQFLELINGLEGFADYNGEIYGNDKIKCLENSDIFILTSRSEGMPMSVLEALSCGVPCILTPGTNMADEIVFNNAGWKTECSAHSIVGIIEQAVKEYKAAPSIFRKAAYNLSKKYDWNIVAKQSIMYYQNIINTLK